MSKRTASFSGYELFLWGALSALLLMSGCTFMVQDKQEGCVSDDECSAAFGLGSLCSDEGYCTASGEDTNFVDGVSTTAIRTVGIADLSGTLKDLGGGMQQGVKAAFNAHNLDNPNAIQFIHEERDDAYDPARSITLVKEVTASQGSSGRYAFAIVGSMGSPTSAAMLPTINERQVPLFGTYSGANHLRQTPPDKMVWNTRASYSLEGEEITRYLLGRSLDPVPPGNIFALSQSPLKIETLGRADLAQEVAEWLARPTDDPNNAPLDPYGMSGYRGVIDALEGKIPSNQIPLASYKATTTNTKIAQAYFFRWLAGLEPIGSPKIDGNNAQVGIAMVPVAAPATDFVRGIIDGMEHLRSRMKPEGLTQQEWDTIPEERKEQMSRISLTLTSISPVGDQLAANLRNDDAARYCNDDYPIVVSQVVPFPEGNSGGAIDFRRDLELLDTNIKPGYVNFEGWIAGKVFIEAVTRIRGDITADKLVKVLEDPNFRADLGLGAPLSFPTNSHDGSNNIYGSQLNTDCAYDQFDF